ncbi:hypothetical protein, partial [Parahaliea maris]|uniref:hypothetical protein n=1 Tax=Parahaliea maris TaxID=2716870 RepID=UPI001BB3463E
MLEIVWNDFSANKAVNQACEVESLFLLMLSHRHLTLDLITTSCEVCNVCLLLRTPNNLDYMVKPHGQLVLVS